MNTIDKSASVSKLNGVKIALVSLGCDKNLVDSETMLGLLGMQGCVFTSDITKAQVIIINTCGFLQDAIAESRLAVNSAVSQKKQGLCRAVIVAGCAAQRYKEEFADRSLDIDGVIGTMEYNKIVEVIEQAFDQNMDRYVDFTQLDQYRIDENIHLNRVLSTPKHYAYLKIAEGCDKTCTYCAIPRLRGHFRSRTLNSLLEEAHILASMGVKELILVAQDTTLYGTDIYGEQKLHELLARLSEIDGIKWLRILYCYPEHIYDGLINEMKNNPKVLQYLDMPIQHAADRVLKLMARRSNQEKIRTTISKLRDAMPDIILRTTLISGFPGEQKEDFIELCRFIKDMQFDRLGVFTYSREEGTPADKLPNHLTQKTKNTRKDRLMQIQQEISVAKFAKKIGSEIAVLTEGKEGSMYFGRSYADAPQIDGLVFFESKSEVTIGSFANVKVTETLEYDLLGEAISFEI